MKIFLVSILLSALGVTAALLIWASSGVRSAGNYKKQDFWSLNGTPYKPNLAPGEKLVVMSWNIAFAHGTGSEGVDYKQKSEKEYQESLEQIARVVLKNKVDILLLQEVDFKADRTYQVNQANIIASKLLMTDTAPVVSWKLRYLPFPGSPLDRKKHFGLIESGGAILSRFRLENHEYDLLEKPSENPWHYNLFYPSRYIQSAEAFVVDRASKIINLHLEAFKVKNRLEHIEKLNAIVKEQKPLIIGGDFNTFDTSKVETLVYEGDNYTGDTSFQKFKSNLPDNYAEALEQDSVFLGSFPASKPNRRLDYIFYDSNRLKLVEANVVQGVSQYSDHLPVIATFLVL